MAKRKRNLDVAKMIKDGIDPVRGNKILFRNVHECDRTSFKRWHNGMQ